MIDGSTQLCMVIGHPAKHSLSPVIHNAGYQAAGIDDKFVYVACDVEPERIEDFVRGIRAMGVRGVSCTMPHKEIIMPYLDVIDPVAKKVGAVNTVVQENGKLYGYNTDWLGVVTPLKSVTQLQDKKAFVLGAGGAARAMVYGLLSEGASVTVYNRTAEKAEALAREFGCQATTDISAAKEADIICNATSVGMHPHEGQTPLSNEFMRPGHIIFDSIYAPYETKLLRDAETKGAQIIHGTEMLLGQAVAQFELYTGQSAPIDGMRTALMKEVSA